MLTGVPQTRTRAFFIAIKCGRSFVKTIQATHQVLNKWRPSFVSMPNDFYANSNGSKEWHKNHSPNSRLKSPVTVSHALNKYIDKPLQETNGHFVKDSFTAATKNAHIDNNHDNDSQNVKRTKDNTLKRDYYSPTILASGPKSAGKGETGGSLWHFQHNRTPTIREASILMGFDESFNFKTSLDSTTIGKAAKFDAFWRMIGNAVIPPIAQAIGSAILTSLGDDTGIEDELNEELGLHKE